MRGGDVAESMLHTVDGEAPSIQGSRYTEISSQAWRLGLEVTGVLDSGFWFPWASNSSYLSSTHNVQALCQKLPIESEDACFMAEEAQA